MTTEDLIYKLEEDTRTMPHEYLEKVTKTVSFEEFKKLEAEFDKKQQDRLKKCENVDGDFRCEECGSSLWFSEVRFRLVYEKNHEPTGNILNVKEVWYCININRTGCRKPPPLVSPIGVIQPEYEASEDEEVRDHIKKLG